ncbi:MAG: hypothetical protein QOE64_274 [Frankiales bacterium]|nr:hypothetical protein [Frankiales bacterium]
MTDHPSVDLLADLAAGVAVDPAVAEHAAGCAECTADLAALAAVSADLAALPAVARPTDIAARIDAALDAEARPSAPAANVVPLASRRRRVPGWVSAAAVALVAIGGSALLVANGVFDGLGSPSRQDSHSGATRADAPHTVLSVSGTDYSAQKLAGQLTGLLSGVEAAPQAGVQPGGGSGASPLGAVAPTPAPTAGPTTAQDMKGALTDATHLATLTDPTQLANCLARGLGPELGNPLAVDLARFNGKPAVIAAYTADGPPGRVDVYVLDPACPEGSFIYFARLKQPTPS